MKCFVVQNDTHLLLLDRLLYHLTTSTGAHTSYIIYRQIPIPLNHCTGTHISIHVSRQILIRLSQHTHTHTQHTHTDSYIYSPLLQPFLEPDHFFHSLFLPPVYAITLPLIAGVILLACIGKLLSAIVLFSTKIFTYAWLKPLLEGMCIK